MTIILKTPREAWTIYSQDRAYPRQRHIFAVKFSVVGTPNALNDLTFAVKTVDRPKVNPKTEELNQYNKKRHIFTGYKLEPIRMDFYDSQDGAAQKMWTNYARFYFGDFADGSEKYYPYDITSAQFLNGPKGFGFTAATGNTTDQDPAHAQFYLGKIQIFHFYDECYDSYDLINPRITAFEPDQLDYEQGGVAMIHATFVYENLQYHQTQSIKDNKDVADGVFSGTGAKFDGAVQSVQLPEVAAPLHAQDTTAPTQVASAPTPLLARPAPVTQTAAATSTTPTIKNGIDGPKVDMAQTAVAINTTGYGTVDQKITQALLSDPPNVQRNIQSPGVAAFQDVNATSSPSEGVVYQPQVYAAINAQQSGAALYGYKPQPVLRTPYGIIAVS